MLRWRISCSLFVEFGCSVELDYNEGKEDLASIIYAKKSFEVLILSILDTHVRDSANSVESDAM